MIASCGPVKSLGVDVAPFGSAEKPINLCRALRLVGFAHGTIQTTLWVMEDQIHTIWLSQRSDRFPVKIYAGWVEKCQIEG